MRSGKASDGGDGKVSLGLLQQYDQLEESSDPAGPSEVSHGKYMNKRMRLAAAMDSIYVNLLVISLVLLDVISIAYFELQAWKDCFDRDFPAQEARENKRPAGCTDGHHSHPRGVAGSACNACHTHVDAGSASHGPDKSGRAQSLVQKHRAVPEPRF